MIGAWRRWRAAPRRRFWRWDAPNLYLGLAQVPFALWFCVIVTATKGEVLQALAFLCLAVGATYVAWAWLRKPLAPEDDRPRDPPSAAPADRARSGAERAAWRVRDRP